MCVQIPPILCTEQKNVIPLPQRERCVPGNVVVCWEFSKIWGASGLAPIHGFQSPKRPPSCAVSLQVKCHTLIILGCDFQSCSTLLCVQMHHHVIKSRSLVIIILVGSKLKAGTKISFIIEPFYQARNLSSQM